MTKNRGRCIIISCKFERWALFITNLISAEEYKVPKIRLLMIVNIIPDTVASEAIAKDAMNMIIDKIITTEEYLLSLVSGVTIQFFNML